MINAKQTLDQLTQSNNGARRLNVMIGAKNFIGGENHVSFRFPRGTCTITLESNDLYRMSIAYRGQQHVESGLYCDMLKSEFESTTGLYLSL